MIAPLMVSDRLDNKPGTVEERVDYSDLHDSFKVNIQLNSAYEISFTATYMQETKAAYNMLQMKRYLLFNGQWYTIQQIEETIDENDMPALQITANAMLLDLLKNVRIDPSEPTEDNPETDDDKSTGSSTGKDQQPAPGTITVKKTDEQQTFTLQNRLDTFLKGNNQGIKYELHGNFPQAAVDCSGALDEWLNSNLATFGAYYVPDNYTLKIYDLPSLRKPTDLVFRFGANSSNFTDQQSGTEMVNDCEVFGGKMEKDITTGGSNDSSTSANGATTGGTAGNLDSVVGFCKSPINADWGVNKDAMCKDFRRRSQKAVARNVDVNRLYNTIQSCGVSPTWFFAYELQEQNSNMGWLNHWAYPHGDPYNDARVVCNWIKSIAYSNSFSAAAYGGTGVSSATAAQWAREFGKGTIGRVYLQGTAAAAWELAGIAGGYYGKPLQGCVNTIKGWGGHTVTQQQITPKPQPKPQANNAGGGGWAWPFPSVGEGKFLGGQLFGVHPGGEFRTNGFHDGLDFGSIDHPGTEVHAVHGGRCTISRAWGNGGINWYCVIQDGSGLNVEYQEAFASPGDIYVRVGQTVTTGQVIGRRDTSHLHIGITRHSFPEAFAHAFSNDGTWLDPQKMIKNGGDGKSTPQQQQNSDNSNAGAEVTTTTQQFYSLHYHYRNEESIKRYGIHHGAPIVMDSVYDMKALQSYVNNTVQYDPPTSVSNNVFDASGFQIGDVAMLIVQERNINRQVTLMGISDYNPFNSDNSGASLTWNNTGLAMKDIIYALGQDIKDAHNADNMDLYGAGRGEDHFANLSSDEVTKIKKFTDGDAVISDDSNTQSNDQTTKDDSKDKGASK